MSQTEPNTAIAKTDGDRRLEIVVKPDQQDVAHYKTPTLPELELYDLGKGISRFWLVSSFLTVVILPTLLAAWFLTNIASERYVSGFRVAVRSAEIPVFGGGMGSLLGLSGASRVANDSQVLVQYLQSRAVIRDLEGEVPIRAIFSKPDIDYFSRLEENAPIERLVAQWNKFVISGFESSNSTVVLEVTAFSPEDALLISERILIRAESFVNTLSAQAREDAVLFATREVENSEVRLTDARIGLAELQDREQILDPIKSGEFSLSLAARLREEIAIQNAILTTQKTRLSDDSPSVRATKDIIVGLEAELQKINAETTAKAGDNDGADASKPLTAIIREFQKITDELGYAEGAYASALASLEAARIEGSRKQIYLATVVAPGLPEESVFPRPIADTLLMLSIVFAIWLVGLIGVYAVREHR